MKFNKNIMIKTLFLFVILFALAFSVSADLSIVPAQEDGLMGEIVDGAQGTGGFSVQNNEASTLTASFTVNDGNGFAHTVDVNKPNITGISFTPASSVSLAALGETGDQASISFTVTVPTKAYAGVYSGVMKAASTVPVSEGTQIFTFTVSERQDISVSNDKIVLEDILIGRSSTDIFTITNTGNKGFTITSIQVPASLTDSAGNILDTSGMTFSVPAQLAYLGNAAITASMTVPETQAVGTYTGGSVTVNYGSSKQEVIALEVKVIEPRKILSVPSEVKLGGSNQKRNQNVTQTFRISNTGDDPITGITVADSNVADKYSAQFKKSTDTSYSDSITAFTLGAGSYQDINVKVSIPDDQDSGVKDIGDIVVDSTELDAMTITAFKLETRCMLEIVDNDIRAEYDSPDQDDDEDTFGKGGTINSVLPGSDLSFLINVENGFSDSDDYELEIEMRSIKAKITLKRINDGKDMKRTVSIGTLEPQEESGDEEIKFSLPREINEKTSDYDVEIEVYGTDKNGAKHKVEWTARLDIEKYDDFIEITKARFSDPVVEIDDTAKLEFEIQNMGKDSEDEAEVMIECKELEITKVYTEDDTPKLRNNVLSKKSKFKEIFEFDVKDSYKPGTYKFKIKSYYERDVESDYAEAELTIKEKPTEPTEPEPTEPTEPTEPVEPTEPTEPVIGPGDVIIEDQGFMDSTAYVVLLVVVGLILLAILVLLAVKFFM